MLHVNSVDITSDFNSGYGMVDLKQQDQNFSVLRVDYNTNNCMCGVDI